jgi:hypothetical protein
MDLKVLRLIVLGEFIVLLVIAAGYLIFIAGDPGESSHQGSLPTQSPTGSSSLPCPTPTPRPGAYDPGTSWVVSPVSTPVPTPVSGTNGTPTTPTPVPAPTPLPVISGIATDWGSDKTSYSRGETAIGWTYVTNTGNVPITQIDFTITIKRTIFFVPVEMVFPFITTGLNIPPGVKQQVAFSISIPSDYQGISTAGDYQLTAVASLAGTEIGRDSRNIKIV